MAGVKGRSRGHFKDNPSAAAVRGSHRGYDLYNAGSIDDMGCVRCYCRPHRIHKAWSEKDKKRLPNTLIWPCRDQQMAKVMIDAVLDRNLALLREWKEGNPQHLFGFEEIMQWFADISKKTGVSPAGGFLGPSNETVVHRQPFSSIQMGNLTVDRLLLRYGNGDAWIGVVVRVDNMVLSKAYEDPVTGNARVYEHYPGRWKGIKRSPSTIYSIVGARHRLKRLRGKPAEKKPGSL